MQFGLIAVSPAGEVTLLARAALGIVVLLVAIITVVRGIWSALQPRSTSDDSPDLDTLWERYRQGEISWDEYLRGEIEGKREPVRTKEGQPDSSLASDLTS